jgi:HJR/Mrr/RecB family endonuclease
MQPLVVTLEGRFAKSGKPEAQIRNRLGRAGLTGTEHRCTGSMAVTNRTYTTQARMLAEATGTELWDRARLIATLLATGEAPVPTTGGIAPTITTAQTKVC